MPVIHLSPFSPPRKKLRLPQHTDFSLDSQFPMPSFSGNPLGPSSPLCCQIDNISAGIQGARHAQLGVPISDPHLSNKMDLGLLSPSFQRLDPFAKISDGPIRGQVDGSDDISCLLTMGNSNQNLEKTNSVKSPQFLLFGQPILTEQQMSHGCSGDAVSQVGKSSSFGVSLKSGIKFCFLFLGFRILFVGFSYFSELVRC